MRKLCVHTVATLLISLTFSATASQAEKTFKTEKAQISVETITSSLNHPWGMAMLPNGKILVTDREGTMKLVDPDNSSVSSVSGVPDVWANGQGGLLDIVVDPQFSTNKTVYFTFSDPAFFGGAGTAIASAQFEETNSPRLVKVKTLFSMENTTRSAYHFGSRIVLAKDGTLFLTTGDRGEQPRAQNPFDAAGKVLRINKDGSIPQDNPFADGQKGLPQIWSLGHRNPQGATLNDDTGEIWTLSHGARGGDEINIPKAGKNYGWPIISYGKHYSGKKIGKGTSAEGLEQPIYYWDPSIAPSGFDFYQGNLIPQWKGNLFAGALKDQLVSRLEVKDGEVIHEEQILDGEFGRIRDVRSFPDGALWLLTDDSEGKLLRVTGK